MNDKAKRAVEELLAQTEVFLNEQRAELATYSAILQCFLLNMAERGGPEGLFELRQQVLETLGRMQPSADQDSDTKMKLLTQGIAADFFDRIALAAGFETSGGEAN